ncbi:competence protein ComEC [Arthrobacter livingstonensis]|uniref:Competence protein ComEC n=1 Tax=Arthrobacter livingstonensis TaxID=670078 RepID=A0A2V5L744_9MICC|nr:ComEC/Rec2 family competence protein [Arthrobacter livingstonensis]PYI67401.1 competence protein ComEC [Arthrobacter livingstonensis]
MEGSFPVATRARIYALATHAGRPVDSGRLPRTDLRLLPAVAVSWSGAAVAIAQPWQFAAVGAAACLALCGAAAAAAWVEHAQHRPALDRRARDRQARDRGRTGARLVSGAAATTAVAALCLGTVLLAVALRQHERATSPLAAAVSEGTVLTVTLSVTESPRPLSLGQGPQQVAFGAVVQQAAVHGRRLSGRLPVRVVAGMEWARVPAGSTVSTAGKVAPGGLAEPTAGILRPAMAPLDVRPGTASPAIAFRSGWLAAAQRVWARGSPDVAGLLPGMVMGDRSASPPGLEESMKAVGLTHLTAVSGANCTLVLAALMLGLRSLHAPRAAATAAAVLGLAGFVAVVGPDPSVLRAAVMGGIGCLAMLSGRPKRVGALLSASIVVLLAADPWLALDYAFILSVLATLGLHLVGRRCARWLGVWMPAWLAQAVAIPLAAQLFCAPVIVLLQPRLALYTVPANMAAAPVVALVTTVGTLGMVASPVLPGLAVLCAGAAGTGAWWVAGVARRMSALPASSLPWPEGAKGLVLMSLMNAAVLGALVALVERQRLATAVLVLRRRLSRRCRFLVGFGSLTVCAALGTALWTAAVLGS